MNIMWSSVHKSNSLGHSESSQYVQKSSCLLLDRTHVDKIVEQGVKGETGDCLDAQFVGDILPMGDDRCQPNIQFVGNLLIDISLNDE